MNDLLKALAEALAQEAEETLENDFALADVDCDELARQFKLALQARLQ